MLENTKINSSKLLLLLNTFTKKEKREVAAWTESPAHNTSKDVVSLFRKLLNLNTKINKSLKKLDLYQAIDNATCIANRVKLTPLEDKRLKKAMHQLNVVLQEYLVWKKVTNDSGGYHRKLMDALLERKLYKQIPVLIKKNEQKLESLVFRNPDYFRNSYLNGEMNHFLSVMLKMETDHKDHQHFLNQLEQFVCSLSLEQYASTLNKHNLFNLEFDLSFYNHLKSFFQNNSGRLESYPKCFYLITQMLSADSGDDYFFELKKEVLENYSQFNITNIRQFVHHLLNYTFREIKKGRLEFANERHQLFQFGIDLNIWTTGLYFPMHIYFNIVRNALLIKELNWVESFVRVYNKELNPKQSSEVVGLANACIMVEKKLYTEAFNVLRALPTQANSRYFLTHKSLLIKIFYEDELEKTKNPNLLENLIESLRANLREGKTRAMSDEVKSSYANFFKIFRKILLRKVKILNNLKVTPKEIDKIEKQLMNQNSHIFERTWLLEITHELKVLL